MPRLSHQRCIRDEGATREYFGLVGNGKELDADPGTARKCVAFCGRIVLAEWFFHGTEHFFAANRTGPASMEPCTECVGELVQILARALV